MDNITNTPSRLWKRSIGYMKQVLNPSNISLGSIGLEDNLLADTNDDDKAEILDRMNIYLSNYKLIRYLCYKTSLEEFEIAFSIILIISLVLYISLYTY